MGAGASNTKKTGNSNVDKTVQKLAVVGAFKPKTIVPPTKEARKENIYDFVNSQKTSQKEAWKKHQTEEKRKVSLLPEETDNKEIYNVVIKEEDEITHNFCGICGRPTRVTVDGYPCRVCSQTYHRACVASCGRYSPEDVKLFDRAKTAIGWSCEHCDNICNLLTQKEVEELAAEFEELDANNDASVSLSEFLAFRRGWWARHEDGPMPPEEEQYQKLNFQRLDLDGSGLVDYWEFIKHGATARLLRRTKEELVALLTPLEKQSARLVYNVLDVDGDGRVSEGEAAQTYGTWYRHLDLISRKAKGKKGKGEFPVSFHTVQMANRVMDADENNDGAVTWEEFLRDQALFIISSRPNRTRLDK